MIICAMRFDIARHYPNEADLPKTPKQIEHLSHESNLVVNSPVFFGWIVMLAGSFGMIMTSPGQTYGVSIFIEHFISDLGVSRSQVSTYYAIGTLTGAAALPFVGRRIDRLGPRTMVVIIAILFGLACIYLGFVSSDLMLLFGFVLNHWSWWCLAALVTAAISLHLLVLVEEEHLLRTFGESYRKFCRQVPRYAGKPQTGV